MSISNLQLASVYLSRVAGPWSGLSLIFRTSRSSMTTTVCPSTIPAAVLWRKPLRLLWMSPCRMASLRLALSYMGDPFSDDPILLWSLAIFSFSLP